MGRLIPIKDCPQLPYKICFGMTDTAYSQMNRLGGAAVIMKRLSEAELLLFRLRNCDGEVMWVDVMLDDGILTCCESYPKNGRGFLSLSVTGYKKQTFKDRNNAIKWGKSFYTKGVCVRVVSTGRNEFYEYVNGVRYEGTARSNAVSGASVRFIKSVLTAESQEETTVERDELNTTLSQMLDCAEQYSKITSELEQADAQAAGRISYYKIEGLEYDRIDRPAYRFLCDPSSYKSSFDSGKTVQVKDIFGRFCVAEIIESKGGDAPHIDLLFNRQISFSELEQDGFIERSYNDVNRMVQLDAISRIRERGAVAQYMETVLGECKSEGFSDEDLSALEAHYRDEEYYKKPPYPPTESQLTAIKSGIRSKDAYLVMGPPGTGKTTVILEWVKYFVKKKRWRVLISSQTNKAVDNVIERIMNEDGIDVLRIGSESDMQQNVVPCKLEKKIEDLREKIAVSTAENSEKFSLMCRRWAPVLAEVETHLERCRARDTLEIKLNGEIKKELAPVLARLNAAYREVLALKEKIVNRHALLIKKRNKLKEKKGLIALIRRWIFNLCVPSLAGLAEKHKAASENYSLIYKEYSALCDRVFRDTFLPYDVQLENCKTFAASLFEVVKSTDEFEFFSFPEIKSAAQLINTATVKSLCERMRKFLSDAEGTIRVLGEWRDEISSTQSYSLEDIVLQSVNLVGATCIGTSSQKRFSSLDFDVTIIDEAGQILIHNALVPMSVSNKLIMLGDHKQLPPYSDERVEELCADREIPCELLRKSLFELLYDRYPVDSKNMLNVQFRMPAEIADFLSTRFYGGKYDSVAFKRNMPSLLPQLSEKPFVFIDTSASPARFEKTEQVGNKSEHFNDLEGDIITRIVRHLDRSGYDMDEVGVIAGLDRQVNEIREKLSRVGIPEKRAQSLVATLDSFQGQERDVILFSFTRSARKSPQAIRVGFLTELRRLNVAMSRCKKMLILVGDAEFLSHCERLTDREGNEIPYEECEKHFSDFINAMLTEIRENGAGEIVPWDEFEKRTEGWR